MITNPQEMRALVNDLSQAAWSLAAIGVLFESGLIDRLTEPRTVDELAGTALSATRIRKLLAVAVVHGVVVEDGTRYRLAEGVVPVVCGPMRATFAGEVRSNLMQPLALLETARASSPSIGWSHTDPALLTAQGDASSVLPTIIKMALAPMLGDLATRLARPGARFLDIGTGVGALAISACRAYPELRVVGVDASDTPLAIARTNVARAGLGDRVELRQMLVEELRDEAMYACAWVPAFFITESTLPAALARVAASIEPGGWLLMGIPGHGDAKQRAVSDLVSDVWGGPTPTNASAEAMLRDAGLREVRTMPGPAWAPQMIAGCRSPTA